MFNFDRWREILDTLWRSKLRSALTAFSMAWGIFMLVVLLGLGNGLQNGVQREFADDATNSVWIRAGATSIPHEGLPTGRRVVFANGDIDAVNATEGVDKVTGRFYIGGNRFQSAVRLRVGDIVRSYDVRSVHPDHLYLERTIMVAGRFLNDEDIRERRKVLVIGEPVARWMFEGEDPIGRWIEVNRVSFRVIGVFTDAGEEDETEMVYIPITTAQAAFNGADRVNQLMFTVDPSASVAEAKALEKVVVGQLAEAHDFSPHDQQAVWVRNNVENFEKFMQIFTMISIFVSVMAGCTLLAGIIGISNIMMIVVRERTREIGVRKALGATPANIVTSIVQEAVFLTAAAGYLGLVAGVGVLALLDSVIPPSGSFANPQVSLDIALIATGVLITAGALAGLFPALAAARVNPIEALREE
jgi:putative ABC transport system permease protein